MISRTNGQAGTPEGGRPWAPGEPLTDRAEAWAATMRGHAAAGRVRTAHSDSDAGAGPVQARRREEREEVEGAQLSPGATRALAAGDRETPEEPDELRTCFERDRDRILHSTAFRRLAGKTQVFIFPQDHQRTRLTHALEVAQVATAVSSALRLNVALTEAIALGHDCGHGPGGHASEDALSAYVAGGFDHAVWGADVVLLPLNLCRETSDGIRCHSWSRPAPSTPEGEVVSWADRIAYVCHDFEDAVRAGVVSRRALPSGVRRTCGETRGQQLGAFIEALVETSAACGRIAMAEEPAEALGMFREANYELVYLRPESLRQGQMVVDVLRALVDHLSARPHLVPDNGIGVERPVAPGSEAARHEAVAHVAGMTDRFAFQVARDLLGWPAARIPASPAGAG